MRLSVVTQLKIGDICLFIHVCLDLRGQSTEMTYVSLAYVHMSFLNFDPGIFVLSRWLTHANFTQQNPLGLSLYYPRKLKCLLL